MSDGLVLHISASDEEADELARALLRELERVNVGDVDLLPAEDLPDNAKGIGSLFGWLAVQFGSAEGLRLALRTVKDWAARNNRTIECSIGSDFVKLSGASLEVQQKIIEVWLARQSID